MEGYPTFEEYTGGGSLLNEHTTVKNLKLECERCGITEQSRIDEVWRIVSSGYSIIIQDGLIRAIQRKT